MNKKKALSLLLAASMVFSMNTVAFAAETTTAVEGTETVNVQAAASRNEIKETHGQYLTAELVDKLLEVQKANASQTANAKGSYSSNASRYEYDYDSFENEAAIDPAKTAQLDFDGFNALSVVTATGSKIKAADIFGNNRGYHFDVVVSANGYAVPLKSIKITSKGKNVGDVVKFKFNNIMSAKNVVKVDSTGNYSGVSLTEAKKAYKDLKTAFKSIKSMEFQTVVCPKFYTHTVSMDYVKEVIKASPKKIVSYNAYNGFDMTTGAYDFKRDMEGALVVTVKNGSIKKVQVPVFKSQKETNWYYGRERADGTIQGLKNGYDCKISFKTLKKNKDYTISGNYVLLDSSNTYFYYKDDVANFETK